MLLQTFSRELVVADYQMNKERITELFCVNKDKPKLQCNGKCHLAKQLRKASDRESKTPAGIAKMKHEVVLPFALRVPAPALGWPQPLCFAAAVYPHWAQGPVRGIFHPPAFQA